jgi:signal transduction histidine kinase
VSRPAPAVVGPLRGWGRRLLSGGQGASAPSTGTTLPAPPSRTAAGLPLPAQYYILAVVALGAFSAPIAVLLTPGTIVLNVPFVLLLGAALVAQLVGVQMPTTTAEARISYSLLTAVLVASLLLLPLISTLVIAAVTMVGYWIKRRYDWRRGLFNISQHLVSVVPAGLLWHAIRPVESQGLVALQWYGLALVVGLTFYFTNIVLVGQVIVLSTGRSFFQTGAISRVNFFREVVLIWMGVLVANLWLVNPWLTPLLVVPMVALSQMLRGQVEAADSIRQSQVDAEGRARELAGLNELARALTSSIELDQISEALATQIGGTIPLHLLGIGVYEASARQLSFAVWQVNGGRRPPRLRPIDDPAMRRVVEAEHATVIDAAADPALVRELCMGDAQSDTTAVITLPMKLRDHLIGLIIIGGELRETTPSNIDLLSTMASQAAVAIEKAQLFGQERRRSALLSAITQATRKIATILNVDILLQQTSRLIEESFGFSRVEVVLREGDDPLPPVGPDERCTDIPILTHDRASGVLRVWQRPGVTFSPDDVSMLQMLADGIAVGIENARLYERQRTQMEELERTQLQLVQSAKLATIGELAAFVAHEINNPLTSVLGYTSLLLSEAGKDDPIRADLQVVENEAIRAREIVRNLLDYARQTGTEEEPTQVESVIESVLPLVKQRAQHVTITTHFDHVLPSILADVNGLKQVFINFLNNAIDAMPRGGVVDITARSAPEVGRTPQVEIVFQDSGVGIDPAHLPKIFDPFFTTKKGSQGTGLGLAISKRIIEQHGGTIDVASVPGQGTKFVIRVPAVPAAS